MGLRSHIVMKIWERALFDAQEPLGCLSQPMHFKVGCLPLLKRKAHNTDLANQSIPSLQTDEHMTQNGPVGQR